MAGESRTRAVGALGLRVRVRVRGGYGCGSGSGSGRGRSSRPTRRRAETRGETGDKRQAARGTGWKIVSSVLIICIIKLTYGYPIPTSPSHTRQSAACAGLRDSVDSWQRQIHPLGKGRGGRETGVGHRLLAFCVEEEKIRNAFPFAVSRPPPAQHRQGGARLLDSLTGMSEQPGAYTAPFGLQLPYCMYCTMYRIHNTAM